MVEITLLVELVDVVLNQASRCSWFDMAASKPTARVRPRWQRVT